MLTTAVTDEQIRFAAEQLISEFGAFPDTSIIAGYQESPALQKLPDYVLARAIGRIIN